MTIESVPADGENLERITSKGTIQVGRDGEEFNGLVLLYLDAPPADATAKIPVPTIMRAFRSAPFVCTADSATRLIKEEINVSLGSIILDSGNPTTRWHADFERAVRSRFSDANIYRRYWQAATSLAPGSSAASEDRGRLRDARALVEGVHSDIITAMNLTEGAQWNYAFEGAANVESAEPAFAPAFPGSSLRIEFSPPIGQGVAARDLTLGGIIAPEKDRDRHFRIISLEEDLKRKVVRMRLNPLNDPTAVGTIEIHPLVNVYVIGKDSMGDDEPAVAVEPAAAPGPRRPAANSSRPLPRIVWAILLLVFFIAAILTYLTLP
ncbi:MAG: hypothetical protein AAB229_09795 [Candidatus Hydrogenedentota bacterium]